MSNIGFGRDPYPKAESFPNGPVKPIDTPEYRDCSNIKDCTSKKDPPIIAAIRKWDEDPSLFDACLSSGEDINTQDRYGYTPLMLAIKSAGSFNPMALDPTRDAWFPKQDKLIEMILDVDGLKLDLQTKRGFTALMVAAWKGNLEVVQRLINMGAKLDLKDTSGRNAWGVAHDWHKEDVLLLLDKNGLNFKTMGGTEVAFPPAPKWRQDEQW